MGKCQGVEYFCFQLHKCINVLSIIKSKSSAYFLLQEFYPVNFLRNLVLNNTKFKYSLLSDVDFMPSYGSYQYILDMLNRGSLKDNQVCGCSKGYFINKFYHGCNLVGDGVDMSPYFFYYVLSPPPHFLTLF